MEARHWKRLEDGRVACVLCPQSCVIADGAHGICLGRVNRDGTLFADNFAQCVSVAMDPIEKKPLYHVCPGESVLSIACNGCNLRCDFCQNWTISQQPARTTALPPAELVELALSSKSFGIAYTYTEPIVWFEYLLEAGAAAHEHGLKNILVTNGVINEAPLAELLPVIDAMNIDLKSMDPDFYRTFCHVDGLDAALGTIRAASKACHVEVTNLKIPGLNDSEDETRALAEFVAGVDPAIPVHFSAYYPTHKMTVEATSAATLIEAAEIASEHLYYVYLGNVGARGDVDTLCPECGNVLIRRAGYSSRVVGADGRVCANCGRTIDVLWCDR